MLEQFVFDSTKESIAVNPVGDPPSYDLLKRHENWDNSRSESHVLAPIRLLDFSVLERASFLTEQIAHQRADSAICAQSLDGLNQIEEMAIEEGLLPPSKDVIDEAKKLIRWMSQRVPFLYEVAPEDDKGISVHGVHDDLYIWVVLRPEQPTLCFANMDGESRRSIIKNRNELYGEFLKGALNDLRKRLDGQLCWRYL